jgi:hypothetical protein
VAGQIPPTSIHATPAGPSTPSNGHTGDAAPMAPSAPAGGRLARMIVVLCFAITILATALIYWRWATVTEPSSYIIVQGDEEHNGTVVVISPHDRPETSTMATLSPENHYAATIFLHPGAYTLTATLNGEKLLNGDMLVAHRRWKLIQLQSRKTPATPGSPVGAPAGAPPGTPPPGVS